ncbi:hypothetical protein EV201_2309 [Ancylomarina subtilis]|uniref:Probable membrane transporter protein n=1 Tax=Ancylomarina subtilis TaxID=1639035 RepID=A0A4Q7VBG7_9BACT|nr:sulfite exporter TauE/SafE family protein [Ancylomarina subtilis]RZT93157.1 hypothetical protein EV201_2309 [Ancylomarina subtilis]
MQISDILLLVLIGLSAGLVGGSLGVGGGIVIVPALMFLFGYSQHQAQGTNLAFMLPPIGILAAYNYYKEGHIDIKVALILCIAFVAGGYIGSLVSIHLPAKTLKKIFGFFMLIVAIKMIAGK